MTIITTYFPNRPWVPFISLILSGVFATFHAVPEHGQRQCGDEPRDAR